MKFIDKLKTFKRGADIHRTPLPELPTPQEILEIPEDERRAFLDDFEKNLYEAIERNRVSFENALPRISLCAFLVSAVSPFTSSLDTHYSWCPAEEWLYSSANMNFNPGACVSSFKSLDEQIEEFAKIHEPENNKETQDAGNAKVQGESVDE